MPLSIITTWIGYCMTPDSLVQITYEGKQSISEIQKKFEKELKKKEILKTTARAINEVATKVQGHIRQQIRKEYTIQNKFLMKTSYLSKRAAGEESRLYAHVNYSFRPIPFIAFKHSGGTGKRPVTMTIKKGRSQVFRHAFIKDKRAGGQGVFAQGRYTNKRFVYHKDDRRVTELKTASPFTMAFSKAIQPRINAYIEKELPVKLELFLQKKLRRMSR